MGDSESLDGATLWNRGIGNPSTGATGLADGVSMRRPLAFLLLVLFVLALAGVPAWRAIRRHSEPRPWRPWGVAEGVFGATGRLVDRGGVGQARGRIELVDARSGRVLAEVSSDRTGRFALELDGPSSGPMVLWARVPGLARAAWSFPGGAQRRNLGEVELGPAGGLIGRVVDGDGLAIHGGWRIEARCLDSIPGPWRTPESLGIEIDRELPGGAFGVGDLRPGRWELIVRFAARVRGLRTTVDIVEGEWAEVEVVHSLPDPARTIEYLWTPEPALDLRPVAESVALVDRDGRVLRGVDGVGGVLRFSNLGPGPFRLRVEDPRFEPVEWAGQRPGQAWTRVPLRGRVEVELRAWDRSDGEALVDVDWVVADLGSRRGERFAHLDTVYDPRVRRYRARLPEGRWLVEARSKTHLAERIELDLAGTSSVEGSLGLQSGASVAGHLLTDDYLPAPEGASVVLVHLDGGSAVHVRRRIVTSVDGEGAFRVDGLAPGHWRAESSRGDGFGIARVEFELGQGQRLEGFELNWPPVGTLGLSLLPPGQRIDGELAGDLYVRARGTLEGVPVGPEYTAPVGVDGEVHFGALPLGEHVFDLRSIHSDRRTLRDLGRLRISERHATATLDLSCCLPARVRVLLPTSGVGAWPDAVEQRVELRHRMGGAGGIKTGRTDGEGRFEVTELKPGRWGIRVGERGGNSVGVEDVELSPGSVLEVEVPWIREPGDPSPRGWPLEHEGSPGERLRDR